MADGNARGVPREPQPPLGRRDNYRGHVPPFDSATFTHRVPTSILSAFDAVWDSLGCSGAWWTGMERLAIAEVVRRTRPRSLDIPVAQLSDLSQAPDPVLSPVTTEVARRVVTDPGRITPDWARQAVELLGPGRYAELVAVIVLLVPVDLFCTLLESPLAPLPVPKIGEPSREVPDGLGAGGAFVPWKVDGWMGPNVARALSYVPIDNQIRMQLVASMYAGNDDFLSLVWEHRALARSQVELLAARTSALNECFY